MVYLIIYCDCTDGGSMARTVRAFSTSTARDAEWNSEMAMTGYSKADVQVDGPEAPSD